MDQQLLLKITTFIIFMMVVDVDLHKVLLKIVNVTCMILL